MRSAAMHILLSDSGSRRDVPQYLKKQGHVVQELRNDASLLALMVTKVDLSQG